MAKSAKPTIHEHWAHLVSLTATSGGAQVATPKGIVLLTTASSGVIYLEDGSYNGQMCVIAGNDTSNDTTVKASDNSTAIKGKSLIDVSEGDKSLICVWHHDGSNGYCYGVS